MTKYTVFADQIQCNCSAVFVRFLQVADIQRFTKSLKTRVFRADGNFFQNTVLLAKAFVGKIHGAKSSLPPSAVEERRYLVKIKVAA